MQEKEQKPIPNKRAAALRYDPDHDDVPVLSAFGEGFMAERIIERAQESGVPVLPDPNLAAMLAKLSVGDDIPPALYEVVARVLLFVGELNSRYGSRLKSATGSLSPSGLQPPELPSK